MKSFLVFCFCVVAALAKDDVKILSNEAQVEHDGKYHYHYELDDGSKASQDGVLKQVNDYAGEAIQGNYAYVGDDGKQYVISYVADENGYQPVGEHLPTPPPVPESIMKALKYLEEHPYNPDAIKAKSLKTFG